MPPSDRPARSLLARLIGADVRSLAALRMALALCVLADVLYRALFLAEFFTDAGITPRNFVRQEFPALSIHSLLFVDGSAFLPAAALFFNGLFAVALFFGWQTKFSTAAVWLLTIFIQLRNPLINQGGDILLRALLFWSLFLPLGEVWSLDAKWRQRRNPNTVADFGTLGFGLQVALLYVFAALIKATAPEWRDGSAVYYALSIDQLVTAFGKSLLAYPETLEMLTKLVVYGEGLCFVGLYFPWKTWIFRSITAGLLFLMHVGFFLSFELGPFPWVNSAALLFFIPGEVWDRLGAKIPRAEMLIPAGLLRACTQFVAALYILAVVQWNLSSLNQAAAVPAITDVLISLPRLDQDWAMFAPAPQKLDGWIVIEGKLAGSESTDLFSALPRLSELKTISWDKPERISRTFPSERWRKYFMNLEFPANKAALVPLGTFLCSRWNEQHAGKQSLERATIYFMREETPPPGEAAKVEKTVLLEVTCGSSR